MFQVSTSRSCHSAARAPVERLLRPLHTAEADGLLERVADGLAAAIETSGISLSTVTLLRLVSVSNPFLC